MKKPQKLSLLLIVVFVIVIVGYLFVNKHFFSIHKSVTSIEFQAGGGCGNIFVYKTNRDDSAGISVSAEKAKLDLSTTAKTFEIGKVDGLNIGMLIGKEIRQLYCNDVIFPDQPRPQRLIGKNGQAIISISDNNKSQSENNTYTTTVILRNVRFVDEKGKDVDITIDELIFKDIRVGWYVG